MIFKTTRTPKLALALGVASALMAGAVQAATPLTDPVKAALSPSQQAFQHAATAFKASSPQLASASFTIDDQLVGYFQQQSRSSYVPLAVNGSPFVTDSEGKALNKPEGLYFVTGNGLESAQSIINDYRLSLPENRDWPSVPVAEGVEKQGDLFVLTDPTCGYCQKVHSEVPSYAANGIEVHYIPYPRAGLHPQSPGYTKWLAAACSDDPAKAYDEIIMGTDKGQYPQPAEPSPACAEVIERGFALGQQMGVRGTPYMYGTTLSGRKVAQSGYVPVAQMSTQLGIVIKPDNGAALLH